MRILWSVLLVPALVAGCAKPPPVTSEVTAYALRTDPLTTEGIPAEPFEEVRAVTQDMPPPLSEGPLAGRTLNVASNAELALAPGEVVLTFDDGPRPGKTQAILDALDAYGVHATFLMLGEAAQRHPGLVQEVAQRGHTVGTHTFSHVDLTTLSLGAALGEMQLGYDAVARPLAEIGLAPSRFFRFPYLAQTGVMRTRVMENDFVVLDVDIDSKDYYRSTPGTLLERVLARLDARGRGVVLFHDIHARTVAMLPDFLKALKDRGYSVVTLRSQPADAFGTELVMAALRDSADEPL